VSATTERGMTLMECAAALALIGIAILAADAFLSVQPQLTERLRAQQEALRALEYTLEPVRYRWLAGLRRSPCPSHQR